MSIFFSSKFARFTSLVALLLAPACSPEEGSSETDDATDSGGGTTGGGSGNTSASSAATTANTTANTTTTSTSGSTTAASAGGTGGEMCYGDFNLGSVPFSGDPSLGQACDDPNVPKNCADGTFIMFPQTGECICIAMCSSLGVQPGQACIDGTDWVCEKIQATNSGMNSATACVNKQWNLCTAP